MLLLLTALFACEDKPQDTSLTDTADSSDTSDTDDGAGQFLSGLDFLLTEAQGYEPVADQILLSFTSADEFGFAGGCNSFGGTFSVQDGLFVADELNGTLIGCEQGLNDEDEWLVAFFTASPSIDLENGILTLVSEDATLIFSDRSSMIPAVPLVDTVWSVDGFTDGGISTAYNLDQMPSVTFNADETISLSTGCNSGVGTYALEGGSISVNIETYSYAMCPDDIADEVEGRVVEIFIGPVLSYEIEGNRLQLINGEKGLSAIAE